jgi:cyclic pyranopterin phosphate synthase
LGVKLNAVILKDINDTEVISLFEYAKKIKAPIRFIEFMENQKAKNLKALSSDSILNELRVRYNFKELPKEKSSSREFFLDDGYKFGIIEPYRENFCESCNRIRLTAEGFLIPCLYFDEAKSIQKALKDKNLLEALEILKSVIKDKPKENRWSENVSNRAFYETGG